MEIASTVYTVDRCSDVLLTPRFNTYITAMLQCCRFFLLFLFVPDFPPT